MLVVSRKIGEEIVIDAGGGIVVTIVDIRGDKVRVGVTANRDVAVNRKEVAERIAQEAVAA